MTAPPADESVEPRHLAAVDLGSNSFHLVVARAEAGHLHVIDRLREPVRLAAGLDSSKRINPPAMVRGLACLERFGERLGGIPPRSVRAVGTNTLRRARNGESFRLAAEGALGHPIEVISGREEARLIYVGVAHGLAAGGQRRLVVDIGGGSTEFIVGEGFDPLYRESLFMGCVGMSRRFFADGRVDKRRFRAAELASRVELEPVEARYRGAGWERAVGCSGTIRSIAAIARAQGWCGEALERGALRRLRRAMVDAGHVNRLELAELRPDRRPVLPGGLAVLTAVFDALGVEAMDISPAALREGLLYDLEGRVRGERVRARTVARVAERFCVDAEHARRVADLALALHGQLPPEALSAPGQRSLLEWSALLHEVGLAVSHNQHHKHGGYILANADLAGFSLQEQGMLAALVRGHRRKFPGAVLGALPEPLREPARALCVVLRLAALMYRSRTPESRPTPGIEVRGDRVSLRFPADWLAEHPLTQADLEGERDYLASAGLDLDFG